MTSTLQQEGGRKLRLSASQVMRAGPGSVRARLHHLHANRQRHALATRRWRRCAPRWPATYGDQFLSPAPRQFTSKIKNAQEAHEAIRPTTPLRCPDAGRPPSCNGQELALYRMIWQRTLASQMADATGTTGQRRASARPTATTPDRLRVRRQRHDDHVPRLPPGVRRVDRRRRRRRRRPRGAAAAARPSAQAVPVESLTPNGHTTSPPARYTEASLVKRLEELGIGRPSTWASIIQTDPGPRLRVEEGPGARADVDGVRRRRACWRSTSTSSSTTRSRPASRKTSTRSPAASEDKQRLAAATSTSASDDDDLPGLKRLVEENLDEIDAAEINTFPHRQRRRRRGDRRQAGQVRPVRQARRRHGQRSRRPGARRAHGRRGRCSCSPRRRATSRSASSTGSRCSPRTAATGRTCSGATPTTCRPGSTSRRCRSLFKTMTLERHHLDEADELLQLPRTVGVDPADGEEIIATNGRYGPYVQQGQGLSAPSPTRSSCSTITLDEALDRARAAQGVPRAGRSRRPRGRCASSAPTR